MMFYRAIYKISCLWYLPMEAQGRIKRSRGPGQIRVEGVTLFSLRKKRTGSLKVVTSADVQFFAQNQV